MESGTLVPMAQKIVTLLEDDIDGGEATETITFGLDGTTYEIDLNDKNAGALRKAIAPYVEQGRRVTTASRRGKRTPQAAGASASEIREWAAAQGMEVPARGRIPAGVREAYDASR